MARAGAVQGRGLLAGKGPSAEGALAAACVAGSARRSWGSGWGPGSCLPAEPALSTWVGAGVEAARHVRDSRG